MRTVSGPIFRSQNTFSQSVFLSKSNVHFVGSWGGGIYPPLHSLAYFYKKIGILKRIFTDKHVGELLNPPRSQITRRSITKFWLKYIHKLQNCRRKDLFIVTFTTEKKTP